MIKKNKRMELLPYEVYFYGMVIMIRRVAINQKSIHPNASRGQSNHHNNMLMLIQHANNASLPPKK
jgi:hypothetical protein